MWEQARDPDLVGAVIGALELQDHAPPGRGPRESLAVHGGLGAGCAEAQPLAGGTEPADLFRERQGVLVHAGEIRAERRLAHDRLGHLGPGVSHEHRTPADGKIEVSGAGRILDHATLAPADYRAELGGEIEFSIGAPGKHPQRSLYGLCHIQFGHGESLTSCLIAPAVTPGARPICPRHSSAILEISVISAPVKRRTTRLTPTGSLLHVDRKSTNVDYCPTPDPFSLHIPSP